MLSDAATLSVYQSNYTDNRKNSFVAVFYCQKGYSLMTNQTACEACAAGFYSSLAYENSTLEGVRSRCVLFCSTYYYRLVFIFATP
jgi:hypothetical protein